MRSEIQFLHVRRPLVRLEKEGLTVEQYAPKGGITIAYRKKGEGAYEIGMARCRRDELYNKRVGRDRAVDDLVAGRGAVVEVALGADLGESVLRLLRMDEAVWRGLQPALHKGRGKGSEL